MKHIFLLFFCFLQFFSMAQVVYTTPAFPVAGAPLTLYYDAAQGTGGLANCACDIYIHTGVITNLSNSLSDWKYVQTTWGQANADWKMTLVPGTTTLYSYEISPNVTTFYGVPVTETVEKISMVFRNANGSIEGKDVGGTDIYADIYADDNQFLSKFLTPGAPVLLKNLGDQIDIQVATNQEADIVLTDNGDELLTLTGTTALNQTMIITSGGSHNVTYTAQPTAGGLTQTGSFIYVVPAANLVQAVPANSRLGATYLPDEGIVRFVLEAPNKEYAYLIGDFSNWLPLTTEQMKQSPDGKYFWIEMPATAGTALKYQYLISGGLVLADPLSEVILDPNNDGNIPESNYADLPTYPTGLTNGYVSYFKVGGDGYVWQNEADYTPPAKENLIIYETLIRDFVATQNYATLADTLDYLEKLGVNVIQLMPIQEFEGNLSWGYNPSFHMAMDKYYGTTQDLKAFIDAAHARNIAVVADVVFNHAFGTNPLVRMYYDGANNRPSEDNPWLNPIAKHPFNVGFDFNHESQGTKDYMYRCVNFWQTEYHIDGFRFDLSKGFTQVNSGDNVGLWGNYDASRIAILKAMADQIWAVNPNTYVILEHLSDNVEEKELSQYGMLLWGNMHSAYSNAAKSTGGNISGISYKSRSWTEPHLVGYMESHDEERIMRDLTLATNQLNGYTIKDTTTALARMELANTFLFMVPGPKMMWQFGELGYEYCINRCQSSGACNNCRLDNKPIRWDYLEDERRVKLFDVVRSLTGLKSTYPATFNTTDFVLSLSTNLKAIRLNNANMNAVVLGNFSLAPNSINPAFQHTGTWYEYFSGDSITVALTTDPLAILQGEYRIYTDVKLPAPPMGYIAYSVNVGDETPLVQPINGLRVYPNPSLGNVTVAYNLLTSSAVHLQIFDILGREQTTMKLPQSIGDQVHTFNNLAPGQYVVRLSIGNDAVKSVRLLVAE